MATLFPRNKIYWLRDGKHRESLKTKNKPLARLLLSDYENKRLRPAQYLRIDDAVKKYLAFVKPFNKPSHHVDKKRIIEKFAASCGNVLLTDIGTEAVEKYLAGRGNLSPYRWNTERQQISALFTWAGKRNLYRDANPVAIIFKKKEPRGKAAEILTEAQIKKIRMVIKKYRDLDEAFQVALNCGLRVQEVENQRWDDIDWEHDGAKVQAHDDGWSPKDYEARFVPIPPHTMKIYRRRVKLKALSPFVFGNERGAKHGNDWVVFLGRAMKRAGIKHGGWHRARHTYATRATENGMDAEALRIIMGISDTKTLLKYIHVTQDYQNRVRAKLPKIG